MRVRLSALDTTTIATSTLNVTNGGVPLTLTSRPAIVDANG